MTVEATRAQGARRARVARWVIVTIAIFYGYGALVHLMNMASLTGFDWATAPVKWQVLDVVYLGLDVLVVLGLLMRWRIGALSFVAAALSQIVLYTALRDWVLDVPAVFRRSPEDLAYLDVLVVFHVVTLLAFVVAWRYAGPPGKVRGDGRTRARLSP